MSSLFETLPDSWIAMGILKSLVISLVGAIFIACIRQRDLASSLWAGLLFLLPLAFFSGLLPVSWKALPKPEISPPEPSAIVSARPVAEPVAILPEAPPEEAAAPQEVRAPVGLPLVETTPSLHALPERRLSKEQWLLALWLAGGAMSHLPGIHSLLLARRLRRFAAPAKIHEAWQEVAGDLAGFIPVRISGDINTPGVISALRPEVIVPASAPDWPEERLISVLRHECHHVKRRDLLVRSLGSVARALLWFHPAAWWVHSRLVFAQERAADEAVVAAGVPAADYAGHLLETVSGSLLFPGVPMARRSQVGSRIHALLSRQALPGSLRRITERCVAGIVTLLAGVIAVLGFVAPEKARAGEAGQKDHSGGGVPAVNRDLRGSILDRNGAIIATSDPAAMPEDPRGKRSLRWYPEGNAIAPVSGYVWPDAESRLNAVQGTGLETTPGLAEGENLKSTIDLRIQRLAWRELEQAKLPGSLVVMDPRNGEVLALASWPSIDPNDYADGATRGQLDAWQEDPEEPLLNRAFTVHPPGSFAKLILSLAAAKNGMSDRVYFCGAQQKIGQLTVGDLHPANIHLGLRTAITKGSNVYFAQLAQELGHGKARDIWSDITMARREDFPWRTAPSVWLPPDQKDTVENLGIAALGTGVNEVSLLDVAAITSAVAAGTVREPSFVLEERGRPPVSLAEIGIPEGDLQAIREALHRNVNDIGTASRAKLEGITVAGLPFTAMEGRPGRGAASSREIFASFAGYAPSDKPRYAVAIRLSGPGTLESPFYGGTVAAPMAARLLQAIFAEAD